MHSYPIPNLRMLPPSPPSRPPFLQYANNSLGAQAVNSPNWGPRNFNLPLRPPTPRRNNIVLTSCEPDSPDNTKSDQFYGNSFNVNQFPIVPATPGYNFESSAGFRSAPVAPAPSGAFPTPFPAAAPIRNERSDFRAATRSSATSSTAPAIDTSAPPPAPQLPPPPPAAVAAPPPAENPFANLSPLIGDEETYLELLQDFTSQTNMRSPFRLFGSLPSVPPTTTTIPTPGATPAFESMGCGVGGALDAAASGLELNDPAIYSLEPPPAATSSTAASLSLGEGGNQTRSADSSSGASRGALLRACITRDGSPESLLRVAHTSGQPPPVTTAATIVSAHKNHHMSTIIMCCLET